MAANTPPLATVYHGSVTIDVGCDTSMFGFGDLSVYNSAYVGYGTSTDSTNPTTGSIVSYGGLGVYANTNLRGILTVISTSNLQTTNVDTTNGPFNVSGANLANIAVNGNVTLLSNTGDTSVSSSNGTLFLLSGDNAANAIQVTATNSAGGIEVLSGQSSGYKLTAGSGGIVEKTSAGNISITANNGSGSFVVVSSAGNQNLTLAQYGTQDAGILITSDGDNTTVPAINIITTNAAGNIDISNNTTGTGNITSFAGSGGYFVTTYTAGPISLTANAANSSFTVNSTGGSGQTLTVGVSGPPLANSQLILQSSGANTTQAVLIQTTSTAGGILLTQAASSIGGIVMNSGSGGISGVTQAGGGINLTANGATSSFINQTTSNGQDLTVCVKGNTASKLVLCSEGSGNQAILMSSTGTSGGIYATAAGSIQINTSDATNGINIGTITTVPVTIGTNTSTTTIRGNLDVRGTTTTVESTVVQIVDNILELNNGPSGTTDGGVAIKRYQPANDACVGDVIADVADVTGTAQASAAGQITLSAGDTNPDDYYNGWWIRIISGAGQCQVRRIKDYDSTTKVALIYTTADQTGVLNNPTPIEGLDWSAAGGGPPDNTSVYGLYPCEWIISLWDTANKEFALVCSPMISGSTAPSIAHYINLHINDLTANNLYINTINGVLADIQISFNLTDNSNVPVELKNSNLDGPNYLPFAYGIYIIMVRPTTATSTKPSAIFMVGSLGGSACGHVIRLISVRGTNSDQLDMAWPQSGGGFTGFPTIFYKPTATGATNTLTNYTAKVIAV